MVGSGDDAVVESWPRAERGGSDVVPDRLIHRLLVVVGRRQSHLCIGYQILQEVFVAVPGAYGSGRGVVVAETTLVRIRMHVRCMEEGEGQRKVVWGVDDVGHLEAIPTIDVPDPLCHFEPVRPIDLGLDPPGIGCRARSHDRLRSPGQPGRHHIGAGVVVVREIGTPNDGTVAKRRWRGGKHSEAAAVGLVVPRRVHLAVALPSVEHLDAGILRDVDGQRVPSDGLVADGTHVWTIRRMAIVGQDQSR